MRGGTLRAPVVPVCCDQDTMSLAPQPSPGRLTDFGAYSDDRYNLVRPATNVCYHVTDAPRRT